MRFDVTAVDVARRRLGAAVAGKPEADHRRPHHGRAAVGTQFGHPSHQPSAVSHRIVILPSMGFGTGHHVDDAPVPGGAADDRPGGRSVLDVGTGSGVLAIAADAARRRRAPSASTTTRTPFSRRAKTSTLNPGRRGTSPFESVDLMPRTLPAADVVIANLTGALLDPVGGARCSRPSDPAAR